jgi:hypothetical protein
LTPPAELAKLPPLTCYHVWGISSVGRAPPLQGGGHGFESRILHWENQWLRIIFYSQICLIFYGIPVYDASWCLPFSPLYSLRMSSPLASARWQGSVLEQRLPDSISHTMWSPSVGLAGVYPQRWSDAGASINLQAICILNDLSTPRQRPCTCDPYTNIVGADLEPLVLVYAVDYPPRFRRL